MNAPQVKDAVLSDTVVKLSSLPYPVPTLFVAYART
jgi:hypothetical protein